MLLESIKEYNSLKEEFKGVYYDDMPLIELIEQILLNKPRLRFNAMIDALNDRCEVVNLKETLQLLEELKLDLEKYNYNAINLSQKISFFNKSDLFDNRLQSIEERFEEKDIIYRYNINIENYIVEIYNRLKSMEPIKEDELLELFNDINKSIANEDIKSFIPLSKIIEKNREDFRKELDAKIWFYVKIFFQICCLASTALVYIPARSLTLKFLEDRYNMDPLSDMTMEMAYLYKLFEYVASGVGIVAVILLLLLLTMNFSKIFKVRIKTVINGELK